uniref:Uncharacterized protein n=1 Tax=Arundo donax TaxID=35708 RepID=A0A0A9AQB1_ARUDO
MAVLSVSSAYVIEYAATANHDYYLLYKH